MKKLISPHVRTIGLVASSILVLLLLYSLHFPLTAAQMERSAAVFGEHVRVLAGDEAEAAYRYTEFKNYRLYWLEGEISGCLIFKKCVGFGRWRSEKEIIFRKYPCNTAITVWGCGYAVHLDGERLQILDADGRDLAAELPLLEADFAAERHGTKEVTGQTHLRFVFMISHTGELPCSRWRGRKSAPLCRGTSSLERDSTYLRPNGGGPAGKQPR